MVTLSSGNLLEPLIQWSKLSKWSSYSQYKNIDWDPCQSIAQRLWIKAAVQTERNPAWSVLLPFALIRQHGAGHHSDLAMLPLLLEDWWRSIACGCKVRWDVKLGREQNDEWAKNRFEAHCGLFRSNIENATINLWSNSKCSQYKTVNTQLTRVWAPHTVQLCYIFFKK